jgi:hypothetical protein
MRLGNLQREQTVEPLRITAITALATPQRLHTGSRHFAEEQWATRDITAISPRYRLIAGRNISAISRQYHAARTFRFRLSITSKSRWEKKYSQPKPM